jgi:hypothetical protein
MTDSIERMLRQAGLSRRNFHAPNRVGRRRNRTASLYYKMHDNEQPPSYFGDDMAGKDLMSGVLSYTGYLTEGEIFNQAFAKFFSEQWLSKDIGQNIHKGSLVVTATTTALAQWIVTEYPDMQVAETTGVVARGSNDFIYVKADTSTATVSFWGSEERVEQIDAGLKANFNVAGATIRWIYDEYGNFITLPLKKIQAITHENYPYLPKDPTEWAKDFYSSNENILILIGPPGTGKTSLINLLVDTSQKSAIISYSDKVMSQDGFFIGFIEDSDVGTIILEDCDSFLKPREDGNSMMHMFLNISDGIVSSPNKKIIFSTNLPSRTDIDHALLRPGRCFDVVECRRLTPAEAQDFAAAKDIQFKDLGQKDYSLAEIYNQKPDAKPTRKSGFGFA